MSLLDLPIRKRPRRSSRLELKGLGNSSKRACQTGCGLPAGLFDTLPPEVVHNVFEWLDALDLSLLTVTSKSTRSLVEAWLATPRALTRLLPPPAFTNPAARPGVGLIKMFQRLGVLQKRATCLYFTRDRLRILWAFIDRVEAHWRAASPAVPAAVLLACCGRFLHAAIAGWEDCECDKVFRAVEERSRTPQMLERVLSSCYGTHTQDEVDLRLCYRLLYLDPCRSGRDRQSWLWRILQHLPIIHQARLMYLLYGPRTQTAILWEETTDSVPQTERQAAQHFAELAAALARLAGAPQWPDADVSCLLDELLSYPEPWLAENVACLLLLAGDGVAVLVLTARVTDGAVLDAARLLGAVCLMSHKFNRSQQWLVSLVQQVCKAIGVRERTSLLQAFWEAFTDQVMELWDLRRSQLDQLRDADLVEEDVQMMVAAHAEFGRALLQHVVLGK